MQMLSQTWKIHVYNVVDFVFIIIFNMLHPEWHPEYKKISAINRLLQNSILLPFIILSTCIQVKHTYPLVSDGNHDDTPLPKVTIMAIMMTPLCPKMIPLCPSYNNMHPKLSVVTCSKIMENYFIWKALTNYHWSCKIKETAHKKSKTGNNIY